MISIPSTLGIIMLAEPIIFLIAGSEFINAITTLRIISPIIIAIALSNLVGMQVLVSYGKERITLISTIIGAVVNITLNLILIPILRQNGVALGTVMAESIVIITQLIFAFSYLKGNIPWRSIGTYLMGSVLIFIIIILSNSITSSLIIYTVVSVSISGICYFVLLYFVKNELILEILNHISLIVKRKFRNKRKKGDINA
jgi:O-antigen/teichoic acid export membrane protein